MTPPRVVLDTNVVLSALVFDAGHLSWLRKSWQGRQVIPLVSRDTAHELLRVLAYPKFHLDANAQEALLADYLPFCETVRIPQPPPKVLRCRDANDLIFLQLAQSAKADFLITGDRDLLTLAPKFAIPIWTPEALREGLPK